VSRTGFTADYSTYSGAELFKRFCAACHGTEAKGDGPVASSLSTPVPDLSLLSQRNQGQFPTARIIQIIDGRTIINPHGNRLMPVWGDEFLRSEAGDPVAERETADMIQKIVEFLRSIQNTTRK